MKTKTKDQLRLETLLSTMDVPTKRYSDYNWLSRNLPIHNGNHPNVNPAMEIIKSLINKNSKN